MNRLALLVALSGCAEGVIFMPPPEPPAPPPPELPPALPFEQGMRRLSRVELALSLGDLLGIPAPEVFTLLPEDEGGPFDDDYQHQVPSGALVDGASSLAELLTRRILGDPARRDALVGCAPTGPEDAQCLRSFIEHFGRRALRRPLSPAEVDTYASTLALAGRAGDFWFAVEVVLRAVLQDLELLYRPESTGALGPFEVASRLSFALQGRAPADWLLDAAQAGELETSDQVRAAAERLLHEPNGRAHVERFASLWLGYARLPHDPALAASMQDETRALFDRVVFDEPGDLRRLLVSTETRLDERLAQHYGIPTAGGTWPRWVSLTGTRRLGMLSHAAVLSNGAKNGDTSPTRRGLFVRQRLLCGEVAAPPPEVNVDLPPAVPPGTCKREAMIAHAAGGCAGCHRMMDPVGFGLESYDLAGRGRVTEPGTSCTITGEGELDGHAFNGADGLALAIAESGAFEECAVKQTFRFVAGRREQPGDQALLAELSAAFEGSGSRLDALWLALVSHDVFRQRKEEAP